MLRLQEGCHFIGIGGVAGGLEGVGRVVVVVPGEIEGEGREGPPLLLHLLSGYGADQAGIQPA